MREFNLKFEKGLKQGLRPISNNPITNEHLRELLNVRVTLEEYRVMKI
jgi:hypothetical protein